jgi:ArsR family transcriptional regulator
MGGDSSSVTTSTVLELSTSRSERAAKLLTAVADPVRWTVLNRLGSGQACVCDLQEHIPIPANLLSYHLKVLRDAGLVTTSRRGRWIDYSLADDAQARLDAALPVAMGGESVPT